MFSIDITLKYVPFPVSVQRNDEESARATYAEVKAALGSTTPTLIELTCDKDTDKQIALLSDQIGAVVLSKKTGGAAGGRVPGFFSATE